MVSGKVTQVPRTAGYRDTPTRRRDPWFGAV